MRRVSLNARQAVDAQSTDEIEAVLIVVESNELDAPLRFSTDNAVRISDDPISYATLSTWFGADPETEPYLFILASAEVPGDEEGVAASSAIILENVSTRIGKLLRSFTKPPTVHMAVVLASSPDLPEVEFRGMVMGDASGDASEVRIEVSRRLIEEEIAPMHRFTRNRFPGLIR